MSDPLDVVGALAAHQQHLEPPPVPPRAAVIALPPPAICALLAPAWCAEARAAAVAALAEELGGGDGALPVEDLAPGSPLAPRVEALWRRGVRTLYVHGAPGRPGHARALRYRWPGALHAAGACPFDDLFDPRAPVRVLAPGIARVAPGVDPPAGFDHVLAALDDGGDPRRVRDRWPHVHPYALDPRRRLGPWSGAMPPRGAFGTAAGAELRARWDRHWRELGRPELVRLASLGLDPDLEAALRVPAPPGEPDQSSHRARVIAIAGLDGSGKSSHAARLARTLGDRGAYVRVLKLYRQGAFLELANELGARTRRGAPLAAFRTSRVVKLVDSLRVYRDHLAPALAECDAVVMDRYLETHVAAAESQLGWDLSAHPALAPFPAPDLRCWLTLDPGEALRRRDLRGEPPSADEHAAGLRGYHAVFARLAAAGGDVILDAAAPEEHNARAIVGAAAATVSPDPSGTPRPAGGAAPPPPAAPPARALERRCAVHLGGDGALFELGADVLALRGELARWCGAPAAGIPEGFWLEAYAAQLILDLRVHAPARARIALWPGALADLASHGELEMLRELERVLEPLVEIEAWDPRPERYATAFAALGAAPAAAVRLARDHADQLARLAAVRGWPDPARG